MNPTQNVPKRLGDRLLDAGLISSEQLNLALLEQKRAGGLLGKVLQDLGFVTEQEVSAFLAQSSEAETVDIDSVEIDPKALQLLPREQCEDHLVLPLGFEDDQLVVAMADTFDIDALEAIERECAMTVKILAASARDLKARLTQCYREQSGIDQTIRELMQIGGSSVADESSSPIIRLVDQVFSDAASRTASDIHFEPDEKTLRIRFRVDGVLQPYVIIPKDLQENAIARIKVISGLDVSEARVPQDGRSTFDHGRKQYNLRVSTLPTSFGESVVIRLLDRTSANRHIETLGMKESDTKHLRDGVNSAYGMILVTGPTGSGKTTTLYTALKEVNKFERSVFTLEDPIEYRLEYTRQTQVNEKVGLTFDSGLRTLLRQDPDVIFVGETRDQATAQLLVRAALTGHLVLSSMHTNDAVSAIPRLLDLGVEPTMLASTLRLVIAQRLARQLCPHCRQKIEDNGQYFEMLTRELGAEDARRLDPWQATGCEKCFDKGYKGRLAIFESLWIDEEMKPYIAQGQSVELSQIISKRGISTLFQDGLRRASQGETTIEEVFRVANQ